MSTTTYHSTDLRPLADKKGIEGKISSHWQGERIDVYLARCFPFLSRSGWQKRCFAGRVLVNQNRVRPSHKLKEGDRVAHHYPLSLEPQVNHKVQCLYHSHHLRAFYKPPHLPMHEGGRYKKNTFSEIVGQKWGREWRAVHRLDRETSGIILCGNTQTIRSELSKAFRNHAVHKTYYAIACGKPKHKHWTVDAAIGYATRTSWREKRWVNTSGLPATTHFQVLKTTHQYSLLKIVPVHGRTHQIRIHAAYSNLPLVGDTRYHPNEDIFLSFLKEGYSTKVLSEILAPRLCLHAGEIRLSVEQSKIHLRATIPEDMRWIWQELTRNPHQAITTIPTTV